MNAAAAPAVAPPAPPVDAPPAPVAIAPVDPLTFTDDMPEFPPAVREALATPVDYAWVEERPVKEGSDKTLLYVPWVHYNAVLTKAFGPGGYRLVPRSVPRTEGNVVTWVLALFVRIPGTTKFHFMSEAKGECGTQGGRMTPGNAAEGAKSDALVKCTKVPLGIFMELFDPAWRAAWERNYKSQHRRDRAAAAWPAARDGAASPAAVPAASPASTTPEPTRPADGVMEPVASPDDTGEAASFEQLDAITSRLKELEWKRGMVRDWFKARFGITTQDPVRILGSLTQVQADAALALLMAFGQAAVYDALLARLRSKGVCR